MSVIDRVFKAYDVRGIYGDEIDEDLAWKVGHASAQFLRSLLSGYDRGQASTNRVLIGRDMRPHSAPLADAAISGITATGCGCIDIGMCDTPMMYFAINHLGACGGVQVTASHNPIEYNGFKITGFKARAIGQNTGLKEIKHITGALRRMPQAASTGQVGTVNLWDEYRKHVLRFLRLPRPLKIVVDASNGMGGLMIPAIFKDTNLDIIKLNFRVGGKFTHPPDPLIEANLRQLKSAVKRRKPDLGVCLDGDADRCIFVDEKAQTVRCDLMTALLGRHFLKDNPGAMVVHDLRCSRVVPEEILSANGTPRRERVGHAFMKKAMADGHAVFGGELSGHFYFRDNFNCDSGAIAFATAVSIIASQDRPFSQLMAPLNRYTHSGEINFQIEDKQAKMDEVAEAFKDAEIDHLDGVTVQYDDWWANVRQSNTEALLRLTLETKTPAQMKKRLEQLKKILGDPVAR